MQEMTGPLQQIHLGYTVYSLQQDCSATVISYSSYTTKC